MILLVIDCAYENILMSYVSGLDMVREYENVVAGTFSKIYGMGGIRLGWGYPPKSRIS